MLKSLIFIVVLALNGCISSSKNKIVLLRSENDYDIILKSSCKKSAFDSITTNISYKTKLKELQSYELKKAKIRTTSSSKKAKYRIKNTKLIITERCGAKLASGKPFIGMQYMIILENLKTKDSINFTKDTTYVTSESLNTLVPKKIDILPFLDPLTKKTITQLKSNLK